MSGGFFVAPGRLISQDSRSVRTPGATLFKRIGWREMKKLIVINKNEYREFSSIEEIKNFYPTDFSGVKIFEEVKPTKQEKARNENTCTS